MAAKSPIDLFLVWWLRSGRYGWSRLRRRLFEGGYLSTPLPVVNSLDDVAACLKQVTWTADGLLHLYDSISYPQRVWKTRKDDCDGFACLAAALLQRSGMSVRPVLVTAVVRPVKRAHTVCAFADQQGALRFFDNNVLRSEASASYADIIRSISAGAKRLVCWDVREPEAFQLIEFHEA